MTVEQITVVDSLWYYWVLFLLAAIIGSTASSLTNNSGNFIMCGRDNENSGEPQGSSRKFYMGTLADIIIGLAAALAILWTLTPQTFLQLIGIGTVAGYGGSSVLRALVNKIDAQISQQEAQESKKEANDNKDKAESNNTLTKFEVDSDTNKKESINAIKDYLLNNNKEVLAELYKNKILPESK